MTEKRFYVGESNLIDGYCVFDREKKYAFHPRPRKADCLNDAHTLNELHEETQAVRSILKEYDDFDGYVDSAMGMEFLNRIAIAVGMELEE